MPADFIDTIQLLGASFVIYEGNYDLTIEQLQLHDRRPRICGDNYTFDFSLLDPAGAPKVITGATITMTIRYAVYDADPALVVKTGTVIDGPNGRFTVSLIPTDVPGPEFIRGVYDVSMALGGLKETVLWGDIEFAAQVTRS